MSNPFALSGLASGVDTANLVQQLMAVERRPIDKVIAQQKKTESRSKALAEITSRLHTLRAKLLTLAQGASLNAKAVSTDVAAGAVAPATVSAGPSAANGTFRVWVDRLATPTRSESAGAIGQAVDLAAPLATAGFGLTPTTGTFTINGAVITIDENTILSDGVDAAGANTILAKINHAGVGVTASIVNDADGRPNKLKLTSATTIRLGSGADTSNFLTAAKLLAAPNVTEGSNQTVTSTGNLGVAQVAATLNQARLTGLAATAGSFTINGVTIAYDPAVDSLNTVISRINASAAGVTASYDPVSDRVRLTNNATGSQMITIAASVPPAGGGNLVEALRFVDSSGTPIAVTTVGDTAIYRIDSIAGGAPQYSASNTIADALPGITLTLRAVSATPMTVTVGQDTATTLNAIRDFVATYNSTMAYLRQQTAYDVATKTGGPLSGDALLRGVEVALKNIVTSPGDGLSGTATKLADLGITFGAVGTAAGATRDLVLDEAKLTDALRSNPFAVREVFGSLTQTTTLQPGGTGSLISISGNPAARQSGTYQITTKADGTIEAIFTPTGGTPQPKVTGTITANGVNTTLIPGVTLRAGAVLTDGTHIITTTVATKGVAYKAADYLSVLTDAGGTLEKRKSELTSQIESLKDRVAEMERRLSQKEEVLTKKFLAMEKALAKLKSDQTALLQALAGLQRTS
ncbi:MAG: flagellar filament capping protein FliD [Chloroflexota bacterium]|nr:flagellar filament capping protein FliD [Dehalococcoidia bacterium]MDW8255336.1 flagellar filament capping protein FliD [Chloroflexota bacterium]